MQEKNKRKSFFFEPEPSDPITKKFKTPNHSEAAFNTRYYFDPGSTMPILLSNAQIEEGYNNIPTSDWMKLSLIDAVSQLPIPASLTVEEVLMGIYNNAIVINNPKLEDTENRPHHHIKKWQENLENIRAQKLPIKKYYLDPSNQKPILLSDQNTENNYNNISKSDWLDRLLIDFISKQPISPKLTLKAVEEGLAEQTIILKNKNIAFALPIQKPQIKKAHNSNDRSKKWHEYSKNPEQFVFPHGQNCIPENKVTYSFEEIEKTLLKLDSFLDQHYATLVSTRYSATSNCTHAVLAMFQETDRSPEISMSSFNFS